MEKEVREGCDEEGQGWVWSRRNRDEEGGD